jgi:hypothetical protein
VTAIECLGLDACHEFADLDWAEVGGADDVALELREPAFFVLVGFVDADGFFDQRFPFRMLAHLSVQTTTRSTRKKLEKVAVCENFLLDMHTSCATVRSAALAYVWIAPGNAVFWSGLSETEGSAATTS